MNRDEVYKSCLQYFNGDSLAADVVVDKYLLTDNSGSFLEKDLRDVFERNIKEILRIESGYQDNWVSRDDLEEMFFNRYAILQGSPLYGLGNPYAKTTLSNCYVVDSPRDSISGIMDSAKELANLFKSRGGCGIDISTLRPEGSKVSNSAKISTGAWSFAGFYSDVTKTIGQCIEENQLVLTRRGTSKIKDIRPGDFVWTREGWVEVLNVVCNGVKDVYEIGEHNGYTIQTSLDHKFLSFDNFNIIEKPIENFAIGEKILMFPGTTETEKPVEGGFARELSTFFEVRTKSGFESAIKSSENAAFVFGLFLGLSYFKKMELTEDGYMQFQFQRGRKYLVNFLSHFLKQNFNLDTIVFNLGKQQMIRVQDDDFIEFLKKQNFLTSENSESPVIPNFVLAMPRNAQIAYLSGFFETCRMKAPVLMRKEHFIFPNKKFAEDVMALLMSFGVMVINLKFCKSVGYWRFTIPKGGMSRRFLRFLVATTGCGKFIHSTFGEKYYTERWLKSRGRDKLMTTSLDFNFKQRLVSVETFDSCERYKEVNKNPLIISKLSSIRYVGKKNTYDLVLEKEHLFYCQGFYVHNSGRRGALMAAMHVQHSDAEKFMTCKLDKKKGTASNISIKFDDEFMRAVINDSEYTQKWPINSASPKYFKTIKAKELWKVFVEANIASAEPGALFWDKMSSYTPNASYDRFKPICVNPCAEVGMAANSNCRLMSINLLSFVENQYMSSAYFNYDKFDFCVKKCVVVLDDLVDLDLEKMRELAQTDERDVTELWEKFIEQTVRGREIGLGTHALADCLAALGLRYGHEECYCTVEDIYRHLVLAAYQSSQNLAKTRGTFPEYSEILERDNLFINSKEGLSGPRRNISILTSAPTGSISILHQVSSGIEPIYKTKYVRRRKVDADKATFVAADGQMFEEHTVYHHAVQQAIDVLGDSHQEYIDKYFIESHKIDPIDKVKMVAIIQSHIDHSISQTVNFPKGVSFDVVSNMYIEAWKSGLKGLTIYVEGSREGVLVSEKEKSVDTFEERPESLVCDIHHTTIHGEKWVVFVGLLKNKPYEVFCGLQEYIEISPKIKTGVIVKRKTKKAERGIYDLLAFPGQPNEIVIHDIVNTFKNEEHMVLGRMVSLSLRQGGKIAYVCEQLQKDDNSDFMSYNRVIARILKKYVQDGEKPEDGRCKECGGILVYQEGCPVCLNCGYTKCE